jgi:hypothetical protein
MLHESLGNLFFLFRYCRAEVEGFFHLFFLLQLAEELVSSKLNLLGRRTITLYILKLGYQYTES